MNFSKLPQAILEIPIAIGKCSIIFYKDTLPDILTSGDFYIIIGFLAVSLFITLKIKLVPDWLKVILLAISSLWFASYIIFLFGCFFSEPI